MLIRFNTDEDRLKGLMVLIKNTVSRRLRGNIFEIADEDRKLLDDHQLHYTILPVDSANSNETLRIPITYEIQRRHGHRE